jgi:hypothetical protein
MVRNKHHDATGRHRSYTRRARHTPETQEGCAIIIPSRTRITGAAEVLLEVNSSLTAFIASSESFTVVAFCDFS